MAIKSKTVHVVVCDGCGNQIEWDFLPQFDTKAEADDAARDGEWNVKDHRHFCPDCKPSWCMECEADITPGNPRCGDDAWSCANCHTDCDHEGADDVEAK